MMGWTSAQGVALGWRVVAPLARRRLLDPRHDRDDAEIRAGWQADFARFRRRLGLAARER